MSYPLLRARTGSQRFRTRPSRPLFYLSPPRLFPYGSAVPRNLHIKSHQNGVIPGPLSFQTRSRHCDASVGTRRLGFLVWREARQQFPQERCAGHHRWHVSTAWWLLQNRASWEPATLDRLTTVPRFFLIAVSVCCYFLYRNKKRDAKEAAAVRDWNDA